MQYSPISDMFLVKRISPFDIDKEEYNSNNLPRYRGEYVNESSNTFDKQEADNNINQYVLCSNSTDTTSMLFPGYDNVLKNNILTGKENLNNSQGPVIKKYEPLDKRIAKQYSTGLNPNQSNKVPQNILGNKGYGIITNDYSEDIDTLALTKQYPELGRTTQFSASKSIPKDMWKHLGDGINYMTKNEYGERVLNTIPNKTLHYKYDPSLTVPAQAKWPIKSIIYSQTNPDFSIQAEELFHQGQYNFYNKNGRRSKDIPAMNLEVEAKTGVDIIRQKNLNEGLMEDIFFFPGNGLFIGLDLNNKYIKDLNKKYYEMIERVAEPGNTTKEYLDLYKEIGVSLPQEKSNYDTRPFNDSITPEYMLHILNK